MSKTTNLTGLGYTG